MYLSLSRARALSLSHLSLTLPLLYLSAYLCPYPARSLSHSHSSLTPLSASLSLPPSLYLPTYQPMTLSQSLTTSPVHQKH